MPGCDRSGASTRRVNEPGRSTRGYADRNPRPFVDVVMTELRALWYRQRADGPGALVTAARCYRREREGVA
jgi:hypothetical protein